MLDQSYFHTAQFSSIEHKKRFIDYNFFSSGNRQKLSLSTYRNMMILQILSHKSCLYDKWLPSYDIFRKFYPSKHILGVASPPKVATRQNQFFCRFYLFGRFLELHFFQFKKKNYFHSTVVVMLVTGSPGNLR